MCFFQEKILERLDKMVGKINDLELKVLTNTQGSKVRMRQKEISNSFFFDIGTNLDGGWCRER